MTADVLLWLRIVGVVLLFPLTCFVFGYSVLGRLTRLERAERFAACWGLSFAVLALGQFLAFVTQQPQVWFNTGTLLLMGVVALLCWRTTPASKGDASDRESL